MPIARDNSTLSVHEPEVDPLAQLAAFAVSDAPPGEKVNPFERSDEDHETSDDSDDETHTTASELAPNVLTFDYPGADDVDRWLPITLIVIGFLLLASTGNPQDTKGIGWISFTRFLTPCLLYTAFTFPITYAMVRKAAGVQKFALPPSFAVRCFSIYMPAFVLITWMQMAGDGLSVGQLIAGLFGVGVSSALLWLLLRLREEHIGTTVAYGAGGFAIGVGFTIALTIGLNKITELIVIDQHAQASVPVSPIGQGLAWVEVPPAPVAVAVNHAPVITSAPVTETTPAEMALGTPMIGRFDSGNIPGVFSDIFHPLGSAPFVAVVRNKPNAINIESWDLQTWQPKPGVLQLPGRPAGNIVLSTDGQRLAWIAEFPRLSIQIWSFDTGSVVSCVDLDRAEGHADLIGFISSTLLVIDRTIPKFAPVASLPGPTDTAPTAAAVPVVNPPVSDDFFQELNAKSRHRHLQPEETPATTPAAVTPPDPVTPAKPQFVYQPSTTDRPAAHQLSVVDVTTGSKVRSFTLPDLAYDASAELGSTPGNSMRNGQNFAISISTRRLAAVVRQDNVPTLLQIDLVTGETLNTVKISEIDPTLSGSPSGLAYSNDGTNLAALFENGGSALLLAYESTTGKKTSDFVYPSGPLDGTPHATFHGSSICWLDPSPYWLVYGQGLVSTQTGAHVKAGDLNLSSPLEQRFLDEDRVQLINSTPQGKRLHILDLDRTKLETGLDPAGN